MGQLQLRAEVHGERLLQARELFFEQGDHPDSLVDPYVPPELDPLNGTTVQGAPV